ncbi:MAG: PAS domain-containing protein [Oscillospiraceae bacterium]|nr:PAS domain-containing protein [Oscillospiraceae bacterium]
MERTENWNEDTLFDLIPEGILAVDRDLVIRRINRSARQLLGIREETVCEGKAVKGVMDESGFCRLRNGRQQFSDCMLLPEKNRWIERSFLCDRERTILLCVMQDVTRQRVQEEQLRKNLEHALELADALNEEHLRTVHDVASLLGENAAETQIVLRGLKEALCPPERKENG